METKQALLEFGLSGKKADVYLAALELGSASVIEISKKAGIKRTTCYDILQDLGSEGLISETSKGKRRLFAGEDPIKIQKRLRSRERLFSEILPQLQSINNARGMKPKIRFYEGKDGLREVYKDTLERGSEILAFASYDIVGVLGKEWADEYLRNRLKKGIYAKAIIPGSDMIKRDFVSRDQDQRRSTKTIDPDRYPFSIEINIYGHQKIALMSAKEEIAVIIEGTEIHNTMKLVFQLLWDLLPEIRMK